MAKGQSSLLHTAFANYGYTRAEVLYKTLNETTPLQGDFL